MRNTLYLEQQRHARAGAGRAEEARGGVEGGVHAQSPGNKQMRDVALVQLGRLAENSVAAK